MKLKVITLKGIQYEGEIESLNVKTAAGEITVLDHHRPLISILKPGTLKIIAEDGKETEISAREGFLEIGPENTASVILN